MDEDDIYNELVRRDKEAQEEQLGNEECENEAEGEQPPIKFRRNPTGAPSKKERDEHETTHIPFREWCPACVMGRGRRHPHRHVHRDDDDQEKRRPIIGMDYFFMKNKEGADDKMITIIVAKEDSKKNVFTSIAERKGVVVPWLLDSMTSFID